MLFTGARLAVKRSTGLVGLSVNPNARQTLTELYRRTLDEVKQIPEEAYYRTSVENFTRYRMEMVESDKEDREVEEQIGAGQLEELIEQAEDELKLIPKVAEWRLWEPFEEEVDGEEELDSEMHYAEAQRAYDAAPQSEAAK